MAHEPRFRIGLLGVILLAVVLAAPAAGADEPTYRVRYRTEETVYLEAGSEEGLAEGDTLTIFRDGQPIAAVRVLFVARHSASCELVSEKAEIVAGDLARPTGARAPTPPQSAGENPGGTSPQPQESAGPRAYEPRTQPRKPRTTRVSGSLTFDWDTFQDGSDDGLDFTRMAARLSLRLRDVGGLPLEVRVRGRTRRLERERAFGSKIPSSETRDRFYEASVAWRPQEGRFSLQMGRLRAGGGVVGVGYLDGVIGESRLGRDYFVGAFFGARSDLSELTWDSGRQSYGLFGRWAPERIDGSRPFEIFAGGVREDGQTDVSREFAALEIRYTGRGVWSFYQRAEIDLNRGWRKEAAGSSSQLSSLSMTAIARLSEGARLVLSYDRYERYREEETRFIPEELFDTAPRQGIRARLQFSRPSGLGWSLVGGYRDRQGDVSDETSWYAGGGITHRRLFRDGLSASLDASAFSNRYTEGTLATFRIRQSFSAGHSVDLTLGGRLSRTRLLTELFGQENLTTQWIRLGGWFELPLRLFLRGEVEVTTGDELEGQRFSLGLGYRF